jgi:uncharacterized protein YggE
MQTVADRPPHPPGVDVKLTRPAIALAVVALASACGGAAATTAGTPPALTGARSGVTTGSAAVGAPAAEVGAPAATVGAAAPAGFLSAPIAQPNTQPNAPAGIEVVGTGLVSGTPDTALLNMSVQATASAVNDAMSEMTADMNRVLAALRGDGVPDRDIATSGLSLNQNYGPQGAPDGYQASESVTVKLHPLSSAGKAIADAVAAGGSDARLDGISLDFSDDSAMVRAARAQAFAQARAEAQQYAALAGRPLGAVESITEQFANPVPQPMTYQGAVAGTSAAVPVNPGTQQVSVSVQVIWALG